MTDESRDTGALAPNAEGSTVTADPPRQPAPSVVTEEPVVKAHAEALAKQDAERAEAEKADAEGKGKADAAEGGQKADEARRPKVRHDADKGTFTVYNDDGTKVTLRQDQVDALFGRRYKKFKDAERALEHRLLQAQEQHRREVEELRKSGGQPAQGADEAPKLDDFESVDAWEEAKYQWRKEREAKAAANKGGAGGGAAGAPATLNDRIQQSFAEGGKRWADFEQSVKSDGLPFTPDVLNVLYGAATPGHALFDPGVDADAALYYLSKHPAEATKLAEAVASRDGTRILRALGRVGTLIEDLAADAGGSFDDDDGTPAASSSTHGRQAPAPAARAAETSRAPAPIQPVARGSGIAQVDLETCDQKTYERERMAARGR